jgi:hypothetical protein
MPQLPAPVNEDINVVLLGALNPAIFHPEWFVRNDLLSEAGIQDSKVQVISPQVSDVTFLEFGLQVLPNRLTLRTTDVAKAPKISDLVLGILTKLSHTPISAVGINQALHVTTGSEDNWHKIGNSLAPKEQVWQSIYDKPGMLSLTIWTPRPGKMTSTLNLTVQPSVVVPHGLYVTSNVEFKTQTEIGSAELAIEFIQAEWSTAIKEATRAAEHIFRKILWEPSH